MTLRPYQQQNEHEILAVLHRGGNPLYVLPTGGGKTTTFCAVVRVVSGAGGWEVGVFVHRVELLKQASAALARAGIGHGVVMPGHVLTSHRVHVASIDTVLARLAAGDRDVAAWLLRLRLAVIDEAHHAVAGKWVRLAQAMARALLFGATATPFRTDGQGLGDVFNHAVRGPSMRELIEMGWLTPFVVYAPPSPVNLQAVKKRGGDYAQGDLQKLVDRPELIEAAIRHYARYALGLPGVYFAAGVDHAHHAADLFSKAGWRAQGIDGTIAPADRERAIASLGNGVNHLLASCDLISEGTDIPDIGVALLGRPTESTSLYLQQVGRASRPIWPARFDPNATTAAERRAAMAAAGKPHAIIVDLEGNSLTHGLPDEPRPWTLQGGIKGQERMVAATRRCRRPGCWRVHAYAPTCPSCGYRYPNATTRADGSSSEDVFRMAGAAGHSAETIHGMTFNQLLDLCRSASDADIRQIARIKGYRQGWAKERIAERAAGMRRAAE